MKTSIPRKFMSLRDKNSGSHRRSKSSEPGSKNRPLSSEVFFSYFKSDASKQAAREVGEKEKLAAKIEDLTARLDEQQIRNVAKDHIRYALLSKYAEGDVEKALELIRLQRDAFAGVILPYNPNIEMKGAENRANVTCYLDSLLFAMFAKIQAFECMLKTDLPEGAPRKLAAIIRFWVNMLRTGRLIHDDMTEHLQEALADCGWPEARLLEQQDTSEAFAFITETLQLPLLTLQVDLFHQGRRDKDDHKVVYERLLNLAVPPDPQGKGVKLEDCLEDYFNTRVDVLRDSLVDKEGTERSPLPVRSPTSVRSLSPSSSWARTPVPMSPTAMSPTAMSPSALTPTTTSAMTVLDVPRLASDTADSTPAVDTSADTAANTTSDTADTADTDADADAATIIPATTSTAHSTLSDRTSRGTIMSESSTSSAHDTDTATSPPSTADTSLSPKDTIRLVPPDDGESASRPSLERTSETFDRDPAPLRRRWTMLEPSSPVTDDNDMASSSTADPISTVNGRKRSASIIQRIVLDDARPANPETSSLLQQFKRQGSTIIKAVTIPAWQFFRLIPWHAASNNEPINDVEVARQFNKRPVVGICLKRYMMTPAGHFQRQNTYIDIPDCLRLPHFMMAEDGRTQGSSNELTSEYKLVLQSVVCHRGVSLHSGHYISFARVNPKLLTDNRRHELDPPPDYEEEQWVKFDDLAMGHRVSYVDDIKAALKLEMPYLLFYQIVPMVDLTPSTTDDTSHVHSPPSYSDSTSHIGGSSKAAGKAKEVLVEQIEDESGDGAGTAAFGKRRSNPLLEVTTTTTTATTASSGPSIRFSSELERPPRISTDEDSSGSYYVLTGGRRSGAVSRRESLTFTESMVGTPAETPEGGQSPVVAPTVPQVAEETTAQRFSRAAARLAGKTARSRPVSQAGEGRISLTMSRLGGLMRASKEPLRQVDDGAEVISGLSLAAGATTAVGSTVGSSIGSAGSAGSATMGNGNGNGSIASIGGIGTPTLVSTAVNTPAGTTPGSTSLTVNSMATAVSGSEVGGSDQALAGAADGAAGPASKGQGEDGQSQPNSNPHPHHHHHHLHHGLRRSKGKSQTERVSEEESGEFKLRDKEKSGVPERECAVM